MSDSWLRYLNFWRRDPRRDVDDEIRFHIEMRVRDLVARGMASDEARRIAERDFGDARAVRAETLRIDERMLRRERRGEWRGAIVRDARVGLRSLRKSPVFAATAVLCAALGIGVTAAVVSAAYAILVRPLPYRDADRLVAMYGANPARGIKGSNISWPDFIAWRDDTRAFSAIGIWTWTSATLSGDGSEAERVDGAEVSANLFPILGVQPVIGRNFVADEETPGHNHEVLLSDRLWRRRFGAEKGLVGKTITVDGRAYTVVGVMPPNFNFPERGDVWVPFSTTAANEAHGNRGYAGAIGRLAPGATLATARADFHRIDANLERAFPDENFGWHADLVPMRDDLVGDLKQPLKVFLGAVALVLLLVCANVANLMLARGATRGREVAIRSAMGASRARIAGQLFTESLLISAFGGLAGIAIAWLGVRLLKFGFPDQVPPFFISLKLEPLTLAFIAAVTLITGLLFGLIPAFRVAKVDVNSALRDGSRGAGDGAHRSRLRRTLVVVEIALSVVLAVGAMLLVRSYRNLAGTDLGFSEHGILSARIYLPEASYPTRAHSAAFFGELLERLRQLPGVTAVGSAQGIPFGGWNVQMNVNIEGDPPPRRGEELEAHFQLVTPDYFKAIGVGLVRGRWFTPADRDSLAPVALVNERMVAQQFGGRDPIGRRLRLGPGSPWATIVGIIRDFRHYRLPQPMPPAVYYPYAARPSRQQTIVVRTGGDPNALVPSLRAAVRELDPNVALQQVQTFDEAVSRSLWRQRLQSNVLSIFAALSLGLACLGLYGVISYAVAQRTRELGVRVALGATRRNVLMLVFGESGRLVLTGVAVGLTAAYFSARILRTLLYGVEATDVPTFAFVAGVLGVISLVAAAIPARRAARVDPIVAMRAD
ncbi:MAG TPA: ABC transporter permease [Gemmatimonadaceae bacterium]|nr:ABC transporter permease [Gemmatimonadaceae bacterium]